MMPLLGISALRAEPAFGNIFVAGPNFSGRTDKIKKGTGLLAGTEPTLQTRRAYVGPEIHNAISGLRQTVAQELELNGANEYQELLRLIESTSLARLQRRNPF